ncbi:MAG: LptF/LptG family permease [Chitinophagales bacterium]|jgi:lipopolysaccharide export system permease protein|nr:LptF/LptG family permease [Chitinophagales bacterium]
MRYFNIIDRYIIKNFLGGFIYTLTLIVAVSITIDISEKIDKFFKHELTIAQIIQDYYIPFIPYVISLIGPYFVFITVIFFTSQLAARSEIVAIFNGTMSFRRFLLPYFVSASLISIGFWLLVNYVVPHFNKKRLAFENKYIAYVSSVTSDNIHRKLNDSTYIYFKIYDKSTQFASNFSIEKIQNFTLKSKLMASNARYDTAKGTWTVFDYFTREIHKDSETLTSGDSLKLPITFNPELLLKRWTYKEELSRDELKAYVAELKSSGATNFKEFEIEIYKRDAYALGIIVLTFIGVILSSKKIRGGLGLHLMFGIVLSSIYEVLQRFFATISINLGFSAFWSVYIPLLIYIGIMSVLWWKYQEQ